MKRLLMVLAVFPLLLTAAGAQEPKKVDEYKMVTYQAVFVMKGPAWTDSPTADTQPMVTAHRNYLPGIADNRTGGHSRGPERAHRRRH